LEFWGIATCFAQTLLSKVVLAVFYRALFSSVSDRLIASASAGRGGDAFRSEVHQGGANWALSFALSGLHCKPKSCEWPIRFDRASVPINVL
jgi:hypothetical protein